MLSSFRRASLLCVASALVALAARAEPYRPLPRKSRAPTAAPATATSKARAKPDAAESAPSDTPPEEWSLRPGADGARCFYCHGDDIAPALQRRYVHTPVRSKHCTGCHDPHTSHGPKLLDAEPGRSCAKCHHVTPASPRSVHRPVAEGRCLDCHDPHGSAHASNLRKSPAELCASCHADIAMAARSPVKHEPVERGCTTCHAPHGSGTGPTLLSAAVPAVCLGCHRADKLVPLHGGYPITKARCTSCHDPHGSTQKGLLYATIHPPVARRNCSQCHDAPTSERPFATRRVGGLLCAGCHGQRIAKMKNEVRVHYPVAAGECLACHAPHASNQRGLVKANMVDVCGTCHRDTVRRQERSPTKHAPIRAGQCTKCHDPHGGAAALLLKERDPIALCQGCHQWQKHASHPLGAVFADPRNQNLTVGCLACHRAHGTEYQHLLPYSTSKMLCDTCHTLLRQKS